MIKKPHLILQILVIIRSIILFTNSGNNSVDYSKYLKTISKLIDIGYNQKWLDAVAADRPAGIKSATKYLIKKQNEIINLNKIGIDSGKIMHVYKSKYPYVKTDLLAKNIDILKKIEIKNRNIFLDKVLKATTIEEIKNYFKILNKSNKSYNQKKQTNIESMDLMIEHDDKNPILPNSKNPVLTQSAPNFTALKRTSINRI